LGLKLLLQNLSKQTLFVLILKLLDALHAELVGISFSYEGERVLRTLSRIRLKQALAESLFFENEKSRKLDRI
jgi:hypothetical protein